MPNRIVARSATLLTIAAAALVAASPGTATVVDRGTFAGSETAAADVSGIPVVRTSTFSGRYRIRLDKASGGEAFLERLELRYRDVYANPLSGASITIHGHSLYNELTATRVSGNVYEFVAIEAGQPFVVRDASGNVVLRDGGAIRHRILFDTQGDAQAGGVVLDDEIVRISGPHPGFDNADACRTIAPLIA
jgi:hypothetical protein